MKKAFSQSISKALKNENLAGILDRWNYPATRAKAYEGIDFEELRTRIAEIKGSAAGHLDELAEKFKRAAEARGAKVFRANSPEAVKDYIANLCKEKGVKKIVKSKSMASEEIHLNKHLAKFGIQSDETDLGEWIVQLAHQTPSHMVMPALHLTKEEVSDLFSEETGKRESSDIQKLVKVARRESVRDWPALLRHLATARALDLLRVRCRQRCRSSCLRRRPGYGQRLANSAPASGH